MSPARGWLALSLVAAMGSCRGEERDEPPAQRAAEGPTPADVVAGEAQADPERDAAATTTPPRVTIVAVGDVLFGRYFAGKRYGRVPKVDGPFADVEHILSGADIAFGNLECPVRVEPAEFYTHQILTFRGEPTDARTLAAAGFDVVSLANNHMRDLGRASPAESRTSVERAGLVAIGAGATEEDAYRAALIEKNGARIAFVARTVWLKGLEEGVTEEGAVALVRNRDLTRALPEAVRQARDELRADFVILSLHWGWEYEIHPDSSQRAAARAAIDAGADLVLGHHPHVVQDIERYHGGVIAYSLGNFLFDTGKRGQRKSVILEVTLAGAGEERRVVAATAHPILIAPSTRMPRLARGGGYRHWGKELASLAPEIDLAPEPAAPAAVPK